MYSRYDGMQLQIEKLIFPTIVVYLIILVTGATGYEFNPGLKINAPLITPTNPELR